MPSSEHVVAITPVGLRVMQYSQSLWRPRPRMPYKPGSAVLIVSSDAVAATHDLLQKAGRNEACVFWYGERGSEISQVYSVRAPQQQSNRGNYHVEPENMGEMVRSLPDGWRPLAQIHSHPGHGTEHSTYDDKMISSRNILSIVFPFYGKRASPWPSGIGVHEWQAEYWHMLTPRQVLTRLRLGEQKGLDIRDFR